MAPTPVLTTARLTLRAPQPGDLDRFCATMTPDRLRFVGGEPLDRRAAARVLAQFAGLIALRGFGPMIWDLNGTPIGHGGLFWHLDDAAPELGWVLWTAKAESHGYALEAMTALIAHAGARTDLSGLWAGIHPDNSRSHALARRLGLTPTGSTGPNGDTLYTLPAPPAAQPPATPQQNAATGPTLTTDRLILRRPQPSDLPAYTAYCGSDRIRFAGGPFPADEARAALTRMINQWDEQGYGRFVITLNGAPIGHAGVLHGAEPEMTWTLWTDSAEARGLAAEAARACIAWAARRWPAGRLISQIDPDNHRSVALAKRLGGLPLPQGRFPNGAPAMRFLHLLPAPQAPVLTTDRLILRAQTASDIDKLTALMGTDRAKYMDGPMAPLPAWRWLMSDTALWQTQGFGPWAIERRSDGAFLGQVSIAQPPIFPELELGWTLLPDHESQGYATEAATAARDWAWSQGVPTLVSYIDPDNSRSIALATRLGATRDDTAATPDNDPCLTYRHSPSSLLTEISRGSPKDGGSAPHPAATGATP